MTATNVVVVGASAAGTAAAEAIRNAGHDGPITVIGQESDPPYTRPALSKALLHGTSTAEDVSLPSPGEDIALHLGVRALGLDRSRREVHLSGGETVCYDKLVIATGARARTFRPDGRGETVLRSLSDALVLRETLHRINSVVIVGGGFIGLELASACVAAGLSTTVLARQNGLASGLGPEMSAFLTRAARTHGVDVRCCVGEVTLEGDPVHAVRTADGITLEADLVVTAIGCRPNTDWLTDSGIPVDGGVLVDGRCRVDADISAAGDVVRMGGGARTPFWTAALDQARVAGAALVRGDEVAPYTSSEFVWTEAFGMTVNILGPLPVYGTAEALAGELGQRSALLRWRRGDLCTVAAINHRISRRKLRSLIGQDA
ncbi:NAD(P)/FAD-dependent oxidoreductase [Streptomyces sp. NPDC001852]|uniref:NAD(P)/FAD-dependent oxidoreductase n=1 Tax=Streptomyces sp. NPDC001852 TaxID=3364619 RepID=UPI0036B112A7